jgi:uncharacterized damage-inducible protein DinB
MPQPSYLQVSREEFRRLQALAEKALKQVSDEAFFAALGREDNSLAVLVKHVAGNLHSRWQDFLTSDGEKPDRHRDGEFEIDPEQSRQALMEFWQTGWQELFKALDPLEDSQLDVPVTIRGEGLTVLQAVQRQLAHYAYHVGQVVLLAKHHAGEAWQSLSIPRRGSEAFNRDPRRYSALPKG